jgi:hypothetical protein
MNYDELYNLLSTEEKREVKDELERKILENKMVLENDMNREQRHKNLVNLCLYPFCIDGKLKEQTGFFFICVDPLFDFETKNFDVCIFNKEIKTAILIECVNISSNPRKDLEDFFKKIEIIEGKKDSLKDLVGEEIENIEYVICLSSIEADKFKSELDKMNKNAIIWEADGVNSKIKISKKGMEHGYKKLNEALNEVIIPDYIGYVNFLPSSHMGIKLDAITTTLSYKLRQFNKSRFSLAELCNIVVENSMRGHSESVIKTVSEGILKVGEKYNIFRFCGEESRIKYYILRTMPTYTKNKYILEVAKENAKNQLAIELETKIKDRIPPKQTTLGEMAKQNIT